MSKIKNIFDNKKKAWANGNGKALLLKTININDLVSEIISMNGVLSVDIFDWSGNVLYSYYRWGRSDNILEEKDLYELVTFVKKRLKKINQKNLKHLIIRSDELNIITYSTEKLIMIIHCDQKAKLPLLTIKAKRVTENISELV
ncbi:MAG: hypothetical protein ACFFDW_14390 [Candidatus Thorarchaeota archaeon]